MKEPIILSDRAAWLERRRSGIGASDAAVILGVSSWSSPYALYCQKLGLVEPTIEQTWQQAFGLDMEPVIAKQYARETGRTVHDITPYSIFPHETEPWMLASLDRLVSSPAGSAHPISETPVPLELKTAAFSVSGNWQEEPPLEYAVQVQHQLAVTGASVGSISAIVGGLKHLWCDVARDDEFIALMMEEERKFWLSIEQRNPPPVDGAKHTRDMLRKLYAHANGEIVQLPISFVDLDNEREALEAEIARIDQEQLKPRERRVDQIENVVIAELKGASAGELPNGVWYTYKETPRKGYVVEPSTYRTLRRKAAKQ